MKKQALSLFLAGALALSLFGCSAQPAAESAPQSSPAETAGSSSAGVVEELHLGTTAANDTFTTFVESGAFGKMCYNSFVTAPFWQTGPNGEVEPFLVTDWTVSEDSTTITCDLALDQGITWHDGEPLTMDDVLFTFDYNINVRKSSYGSYVDHAEQVDEDTIKVVLKEPAPTSGSNWWPAISTSSRNTFGRTLTPRRTTVGRMLSSAAAPTALSAWTRMLRPATTRP